MKKKTHIPFLTILFALTLLGCKGKDASSQGEGSGVQANKKWKTMVVKKGDTEVKQLFTASIQGRQDIEIRPQVHGKIVDVCVR